MAAIVRRAEILDDLPVAAEPPIGDDEDEVAVDQRRLRLVDDEDAERPRATCSSNFWCG